MATVASLFGSQSEASEALDAMSETRFAGVETRVYEGDVADDVGEVKPAGIPGPGANLAGASLTGVLDNALTNLDDEEASSYFIEAVEQGQGVLVVADVDDEQVDALRAFFQEQGGRTSTAD